MPYYGSYLWKLRQKIGSGLVLLPGASVLVENETGEMLLTKRTDTDAWCMPGGAAEVNSNFLMTAMKELEEEVGIIVDPSRLKAFACISEPHIHTLTYPNGDQVHAFALWFALQNWSGKVEVGDEIREVCFFNAAAFPSNTLRPSCVAATLYGQYKRTGEFQIS